MSKIKFIHCADIHLDAPFSYFGLQFEKATLRRRELRETIRKIFEMAKNSKVDFVIISGDLYESKYVNKSTILYINELFAKANPIKVLIIPGNHDPYLNNSYYKNFNWSENVFIFTKENFVYSYERKNVKIFGVGFENFYEENALDSIYSEIENKNDNDINVLAVHGTINLSFGNDLYNPMKSVELDKLNMDYIALGHFHNRIEGIGQKKNIFNPGCPEPLKFGDDENCGVYLVEIEKNNNDNMNLRTTFIKTNKRFFKKIDIIVDGLNSDDNIVDDINQKVKMIENYKKGSYSFLLQGKRHRDYNIDIKYINEQLENQFFYFKVIDITEIEYDFDNLKNEKGLCGIFVKKALEKIENAEGEEKELLKKALYYGMELIEKGKLDLL